MSDTHVAPIAQLIAQFAKLPGIGNKSAQRLAYHVLAQSEEQAGALAQAILDAKQRIRKCSLCGNYTEQDPCVLCSDPRRRKDVLCVVQSPRDLLAMERTREYDGGYHVLGGVLSPLQGIGPEALRMDVLQARVREQGVTEVILATNPDVEGEATALYIAKLLTPLGVNCTRIASGVPMGADLEYTDEVTLLRALEGRRKLL